MPVSCYNFGWAGSPAELFSACEGLLEMNFLRRIMIFALMPMTVWGGMTHVACRCSNGEVRLNCPRLNQKLSAKTASSACCQSTSGERKPCCCGGGGKSGRYVAKSHGHQPTSCCAEICHCTPVYLQANSTPSLKKVSVADQIRIDLESVLVSVVRHSRSTPVDATSVDASQRVPDDLIVLWERWLI